VFHVDCRPAYAAEHWSSSDNTQYCPLKSCSRFHLGWEGPSSYDGRLPRRLAARLSMLLPPPLLAIGFGCSQPVRGGLVTSVTQSPTPPPNRVAMQPAQSSPSCASRACPLCTTSALARWAVGPHRLPIGPLRRWNDAYPGQVGASPAAPLRWRPRVGAADSNSLSAHAGCAHERAMVDWNIRCVILYLMQPAHTPPNSPTDGTQSTHLLTLPTSQLVQA